MARYRVRVTGRADRSLLGWLDALIGLLRGLPAGWRADVTLEKDDDDDPL